MVHVCRGVTRLDYAPCYALNPPLLRPCTCATTPIQNIRRYSGLHRGFGEIKTLLMLCNLMKAHARETSLVARIKILVTCDILQFGKMISEASFHEQTSKVLCKVFSVF